MKYYAVNASLLLAIAKTESGLHPYAVELISKKPLTYEECSLKAKNKGKFYYACYPDSYQKALALLKRAKKEGASFSVGLMQVNEVWLKFLKKYGWSLETLLDPCANVFAGAYVLARCQALFGNSWKAVDCYNKGPKGARKWSEYTRKVWESIQK